MRTTQQPGETPPKISVSQIDQDLKDGINKADIAIKYGIKKWEVDEMFKHPKLTGRKPSRKKMLSFTFVDDMTNEEVEKHCDILNENGIETKIDEVDPNQVTLEDAIDDAIESVEEVKDQMQQTQEAIVNMLSPTKVQTPAESLLKASSTIDDPEYTPPSFDDTMSVVEEQEWEAGNIEEEEELKMDEDTFEL